MAERLYTPTPRKRNTEEIEKAKEEGNAFIQAREKLAAKIQPEGASPRTIETASQQISENTPEALAKKRLDEEEALARERFNRLTPIETDQVQSANQVGTLTPEQQTRNIQESTNPVAVGGAVAAAGTGAIAGAAAGTAIAPGVGTVIGAGIGALGGAFTKISFEKRQDVKQAVEVYKGAKGNMAWIINEVNAGRMSGEQATELFDEELANYYAAERNIKDLNRNNLQKFLSNGGEEARRIEAFGRRIPTIQRNLQLAILAPNPNAPRASYQDPEETIIEQ